MKKWWICLLAAVLLVGCQQSVDDEVGVDQEEAVQVVESEEDAGEKDQAQSRSAVEKDADRDLAELYRVLAKRKAVLGVSFIGMAQDEVTVADAVESFSDYEGMSFVTSIPKEQYIFQQGDEDLSYAVYLLVPAKDADSLAVNDYDVLTGEPLEVLYRCETADPVILVAPEDAGVPRTEVFAHKGEFVYFCPYLSLATSRLAAPKTDDGVWDFTPDDVYFNQVLPFYSQGCFDRVYYLPEVQQAIEQGMELHETGEDFICSYPGIIFALEKTGGAGVQKYFACEPKSGFVFRSEPGDYFQWELIP